MMRRRVVVTGIGILSPNGIGREEFSTAIFNGKSGISQISLFDTSKLGVKIGGELRSFNPIDYLPREIVRKTDRFCHLGLVATKLALEDASITANSDYLKSAAVILGSGQGGLLFHEQTIIAYLENGKKPSSSAVPKITANAVSAYIALQYGIKGMNLIISTACSSGTQAIGQAYRNIQFGLFDMIVTGGVEAPLSPVMFEMYNAMMVLGTPLGGNPTTASRPFDLTRNGFVLSEGAAIIILESLDSALKRNARIYAEIIGFGSNCGAYHMVTPNPSGEDAAAVMKAAIEDAGISPEDVDYISAHGTSTKQNDSVETTAIKTLFVRNSKKILVSSIKSMIGHTIGAAGAMSAAACCLSLQKKILPPTINLNNPDPECDLDYIPNIPRQYNAKIALSNSFGFGSNNASLVIKESSNGKT